MRSFVNKIICVLFAVFLFLVAGTLVAETRCRCRIPPGGSHGCEDAQIAYCKIVNGECFGWCGSKKTPTKRGEELVAAIFFEGLGKKVSERDLRRDPSWEEQLVHFFLSGRYNQGSYE